MKKRALTLLLAAVVLLALVALYRYGRGLWYPVYLKVKGKRTVAEAVERYAPGAIARLKPYFEQASIAFLPQEITLLAMKEERQLELWARDAASAFTFIRSYPIRAASGDLGPKLREGDRQVPEGMYRIVALNPNSRYHLSMKLNYPNAFDLHHAEREGRTAPGSDIFIHGKAVSIGCLAMGDPAIEELFVLVSRIGLDQSHVVIAPYDARKTPLSIRDAQSPPWLPELYQRISDAFQQFPREDG